MDNSMNENVAKRLAFIRYLYDEAVRQPEKAEPMCSASVLGFHDAAELFLVLACEHKDVGKKNMPFMAYWEELGRKLPEDSLTQKKAMSRLNESRVGLKHHGNMPARSAIQEYRSIATLFFEENTPTVFGVDFGGISMVYLVRHPDIRAKLEDAEDLHEQHELGSAVGQLALAFDRMVGHYHRRNPLLSGLKWPRLYPNPRGYKLEGRSGSFKSRTGENAKDEYARKKIGDILEQTDALKRAVAPMQDAMVAVALDIDYKRFRRFLALTPEVKMMNKADDPRAEPVPTPIYHYESQWTADEDSYRFCFDFVIEAVLRAQAN